MSDQLQIALLAGGWSIVVALIGLSLLWWGRRRSLRVLVPGVVVVAVAAALAGVYGAARAMFVSPHDFTVMAWVLCIAGVITCLCAAVVGWAFSRWSRSLQQAVGSFAETGQFEALRDMPAELDGISRELASASIRLGLAREREERLEGSRRELISWVSHDLRSPLAGIRAMAESLEDGIAEDPDRYHRQIRAEVDRLALMVDDLFELSRINAGSFHVNREPVSLSDLVSEALASAEPMARTRGVGIDGVVDDGLQLQADPGGISRVLSNLVTNAIRHTEVGGAVHIHATSRDSSIELSVADGCGGMPDHELERVFDMAWQRSRARTPTQATAFSSGAGLGLAIVRGIIDAHGGTISVTNAPPGCRFLVRLPG
ncbi:sensor histidine kinase [Demetria terragena]|uniref:sensor histidine kinase n=1 Tax=Demetria terragena TaxID=63959 RepID=UPI000366FB1B|nr:HAMP domain-containing sensor histidine kinase [Demetria terragena]